MRAWARHPPVRLFSLQRGLAALVRPRQATAFLFAVHTRAVVVPESMTLLFVSAQVYVQACSDTMSAMTSQKSIIQEA